MTALAYCGPDDVAGCPGAYGPPVWLVLVLGVALVVWCGHRGRR